MSNNKSSLVTVAYVYCRSLKLWMQEISAKKHLHICGWFLLQEFETLDTGNHSSVSLQELTHWMLENSDNDMPTNCGPVILQELEILDAGIIW